MNFIDTFGADRQVSDDVLARIDSHEGDVALVQIDTDEFYTCPTLAEPIQLTLICETWP